MGHPPDTIGEHIVQTIGSRDGDLPQLVGFHEFGQIPIELHRATMQTHLRNSIVSRCSLHHLPPLMNGHAQRFFNVHILPSRHCSNRLNRMPVVRRYG